MSFPQIFVETSSSPFPVILYFCLHTIYTVEFVATAAFPIRPIFSSSILSYQSLIPLLNHTHYVAVWTLPVMLKRTEKTFT